MQKLAAALALLFIVHAAGAREVLQVQPRTEPLPAQAGQPRAEAPGPDATPTTADMAFILSAPSATLAPDKLALTGVASTAQFITDDKKSGKVRMAVFANNTAGAIFVDPSGNWLGSPMAVLHATSAGNATSALLKLSNPHYDPTVRTLTFKVRILPLDNSTAVGMQGGTAARLAEDAATGAEANALSAPPAGGAQLTDAALFIDQSTQTLSSNAQVKHFWWWGPRYYYYPYGGCGSYGWYGGCRSWGWWGK